ncbi:phosphoribosylanthranilate isomerase [Hymenobacter aerilatus]|uniref:N-(5'-phosphoribosyl)anthranilate isomerase n=1 Tax=Hymenobacter aerilatus TaxID=2932251 RepID=A0A8T9SP84_9BACT|nr:phosphoribosylanthranilate isomerase [Hymenobacter aerilatus]UOR03497.1 phosphoribosylanthranilate isomerase [Hymenobacter aerilatus]
MFPTPLATYPLSSANSPGLRIKVCGMRSDANIREVANLGVDFMGFIFYAKSPRCAVPTLSVKTLNKLPSSVLKVGVFVNETTDIIRQRVAEYGLDLVQLHGQESPAQCAELRSVSILVIKAFSVGEEFDFAQAAPYVNCCNYFLFDTKGPELGGNGTTFNWQLLAKYPLSVPYFLAGGLDLAHAQELQTLRLPGLFGIDLNSRFELAPGEKDVGKLRQLFQRLRPGSNISST